jgi:hypothetical protein
MEVIRWLSKMLLDNGVDINAQGGVYGNAFLGASHEGFSELLH